MVRAKLPTILYSATTILAYSVAQKYYRQRHYAWCAPAPDPDRFGTQNPPSSDPISLYWRYHADVSRADEHSSLIAANRRGIARGASEQERQGVITATERSLIEGIAERAPISDFAPLFLVIAYAGVKRMVSTADLTVRARASSNEYIVEKMPRSCFDVLRLSED